MIFRNSNKTRHYKQHAFVKASQVVPAKTLSRAFLTAAYWANCSSTTSSRAILKFDRKAALPYAMARQQHPYIVQHIVWWISLVYFRGYSRGWQTLRTTRSNLKGNCWCNTHSPMVVALRSIFRETREIFHFDNFCYIPPFVRLVSNIIVAFIYMNVVCNIMMYRDTLIFSASKVLQDILIALYILAFPF